MSEYKAGDKCKLNDGILKGLGMADLVGQRWTVKKVDEQGRLTIEMDNDDVEVSLGPLLTRMVDAWTEEHQQRLDAMPPLFENEG